MGDSHLKILIKSLTLGMIFGFLGCLLFLRFFPTTVPFTRRYMSLITMFHIFLKNSFLATLICFGGIIFSLIELKVSRFSRAYEIVDRTLDPIYFILGIFSKKYRKLGRLYRSLYLCLSSFSVVCISLFGFMISFYFSIFFILMDQALGLLLRSSPHMILEITVFVASANTSLKMAKTLKPHVVKKELRRFEKYSLSFLTSKEVWTRLLVFYLLLFFSALLERFFISL